MKQFLFNLKISAIILLFVLVVSVVNGQKTAVASGSWSTPTTWSPVGMPGAGDAVTINSGISVTVDVAAQCSSLTFGSASGTITVNSGLTLAVTTNITLQNSATISTAATLSGAGSITCASVIVGGTTAPSANTTHTTILSSSITSLGLSGNLTLTGQHPNGNRRNAPTLNVGSGNVSVGGTASLTSDDAGSGATLTLAFAPQTGTLTLLGATPLTVDGFGTFTANGTNATVSFAGGAQVVRPTTYTNLTLGGSGAKTVTGTTINGTLSIQGTATTTGTSPTYGGSAILEYKGSGVQNVSNIEFVGGGANPANLTIDNINGVSLNAAKTINGALNLVNGYLTSTSANFLTIGAAGSASTSNGAFVNGPLAKATNTTALFTFPVGNLTGQLRTIGVTPQNTTASTYKAEFISGNPRSVPFGNNLGGVPSISACEYWDLSRTSGTTSARVTVSWPAAVNSCGVGGYVNDPSSLVVAHHNGVNWNNEGQSSTTGDAINGGTVTSNNFVPSFSPFVLATTDPIQNALPVMFADVSAFEKNNGIQIEWSNLTERDLIRYIVERSVNGVNYSAISQQTPRSNTNDKESYSAFDAAPFSGTNYYRIKVLEISGKVIYSKVMRVEFGGTAQGFTLYPNPVKGNQVSISINNKQGQYTLKVVNTSGQEVYSQRIAHQGGSVTQTVDLPRSVKPGVYKMVIAAAGYRDAKMFVVQ